MQSDARLAELTRQGHDAAFTEIVRRYRAPLARRCRYFATGPEADEAVQRALVRALAELTRGEPVYSVETWLYRIGLGAAMRQRGHRSLPTPVPRQGTEPGLVRRARSALRACVTAFTPWRVAVQRACAAEAGRATAGALR